MSQARSLNEFIGRYIDSIETLEILLLLQRSPDTFWRPEAIDSHLGLKPGISDNRLSGLLQNGLVTAGTSGGYRYQVQDEDLKSWVSKLTSEYANRRIHVVNTVYSENLARLRAFAEAFKMKGE